MGPGTFTLTVAQCYDGRTSRQAIKGGEDGLLPALTWFGYNRPFLPPAFKGTENSLNTFSDMLTIAAGIHDEHTSGRHYCQADGGTLL